MSLMSDLPHPHSTTPKAPTQPIFRFAPSPNGDLHLGHALSALLNAQAAERLDGTFLVRVDDIDQTRARPEYVQGIFDDLDWLGLTYAADIRFQSQHIAEYQAALDHLSKLELTYTAFTSRRELDAIVRSNPNWPRDPDGTPLFPESERDTPAEIVAERITRGDLHTIRLNMTKALALCPMPLTWQEASSSTFTDLHGCRAEPHLWGDPVLARKDAAASYALSVVVDDAAQNVSHVIRGRDLFAATSLQRLLQALLGLPAPLYQHHRLIMGDDGRKLSKSARSTSLKALRADGVTPAEVRRLVGL